MNEILGACNECDHHMEWEEGASVDSCPQCGGSMREYGRSMTIDLAAPIGKASILGKRVCIFCGSTPVSREHIWPQWLTRKYQNLGFGDAYETDSRPLYRHRTHEAPGLSVQSAWAEEKRQGGTLDRTTIKAACRDCNSGWMSNLEVQVAPILSRQIEDKGHTLTPSERDILVRWLIKTTAVHELDDPSSAMLSSEVLAALAHGAPLEDLGRWKVHATWGSSGIGMGHYRVQVSSRLAEERSFGLLQMIHVGNALFMLEHWEADGLPWRK